MRLWTLSSTPTTTQYLNVEPAASRTRACLSGAPENRRQWENERRWTCRHRLPALWPCTHDKRRAQRVSRQRSGTRHQIAMAHNGMSKTVCGIFRSVKHTPVSLSATVLFFWGQFGPVVYKARCRACHLQMKIRRRRIKSNFAVCIRAESENQSKCFLSPSHEFTVLTELTSGHNQTPEEENSSLAL